MLCRRQAPSGRPVEEKLLPKTADLTPRQRETLQWVTDFIRKNRMPPTVREIGEGLGTKGSSVFDLLKALERKGYIKREPRKARSIVVLDHRSQKSATSPGPRRSTGRE